MTASRKNEIIAQLVGILNELIEVDDSEEVTEISPDTVEMLTIKESIRQPRYTPTSRS